MKTTTLAKLYATLATLAPSIAFATLWEHDTDARWDADPSLDEDDFQAWQSDVSARAIVGGEVLEGNGYLGGSWYPFGDNPAKTDPEIGGYLLQKLDEAAEDLQRQLEKHYAGCPRDMAPGVICANMEAVRAFLKRTMRAEYDADQIKA